MVSLTISIPPECSAMKNDGVADSQKLGCRDVEESRETPGDGGVLCSSCGSSGSYLPYQRKIVVGYALKPNKIKSFLKPSLQALARFVMTEFGFSHGPVLFVLDTDSCRFL